MRISVTGEKQLIDALEANLQAESIKTERPKARRDRAELAFGLAEIGTLVSIVSGIAALIEQLVKVAKGIQENKKQKLELKTAAGTVTVELRRGVTADELIRKLKPLTND